MKKIITFLFCFGLFTASFAQSGRQATYRDQKNTGAQSTQFHGNDYNKSNQYQQQNSYNNGQWGKGDDRQKGYDRDDRNQYGYDKKMDDRFRKNDRDNRFNSNQTSYYKQTVIVQRPSLLGILIGAILR